MSSAVAPGSPGTLPAGLGAVSAHRTVRFRRARRAMAPLARIPRAGRVCFAIAFVNAAIWGLVVPPFQVPDETAHFGYAQYLAETGSLPPQGPGFPFSSQEAAALKGLSFYSVAGHRQMRGVFTAAEDRALRAALRKRSNPVGSGGASQASNQPPLYYALEAIPYWLSPSQDILARLALMRLLSALIAACTVLTVFMFLRELLPGSPWAWTVGALVVAFQPAFNFIAAGVQGDNLLYLTSALLFVMLLRAYRRGLTMRRAATIGAIVAAGVLTKLTFIALLPGGRGSRSRCSLGARCPRVGAVRSARSARPWRSRPSPWRCTHCSMPRTGTAVVSRPAASRTPPRPCSRVAAR